MPINMAYCRFENTLAALRECEESLNDVGADPFAHLSDWEREAAEDLVALCRRFADDFGDE